MLADRARFDRKEVIQGTIEFLRPDLEEYRASLSIIIPE